MDIDSMIKAYISAKEAENTAKKEAENLKNLILEYAREQEFFETEEFNVLITSTISVRLDTAALYKDFPDIKEEYGKTSVSRSVKPVRKQEKKTA